MSDEALSATFARFVENEERLAISSASESNKKLIRELYERTRITNEDLSRKYTEEEVKELCLRTKVQVNMTDMNCVYDAEKQLTKAGRLTNRSRSFVNRMLAKAVNRGMVRPYSDEEIKNYRHIKSCQLKKDNNNRLDRWKKRRNREGNIRATMDTPDNLDMCYGIGYEREQERNQENTQNQENAQQLPPMDWINEYNNINSESMSISSNILDISPLQPFETQMITTSTQDGEMFFENV